MAIDDESAPQERGDDESEGPEESLTVPQLYHKAEEIRTFLARKKNVFYDGSLWTDHQELQNLYKQILLRDLSYALDKKVEVDLWNACFRDYIAFLQTASRDRASFQKQKAAEAQQVLNWFTHMATGFYTILLEELRPKVIADLPILRVPRGFNRSDGAQGPDGKLSKPDLHCHVYLIQYCLVHLGDLSRYRGELSSAENYYRQAIQVSPDSGQGYNQVALLLGNKGDFLSAAFYYVRALALKHPFMAAASNLSKLFAKIEEQNQREGKPLPYKEVAISAQTFVPYVLQFHSYVHSVVHLRTAAKYCDLLNSSMTSLIATESMKWNDVFKILTLSLFISHQHLEQDEIERTADEKKVGELLNEFLGGILNAFLLPVYTWREDSSLLTYFALPAIKILLDWICLNPKVLDSKAFLKRLQIWPSLCRLLNQLSTLTLERITELESLASVPLPEDYDLQCFLPLGSSLKRFNFKKVSTFTDENFKAKIPVLRAFRILKLGEQLASTDFNGRKVIACKSFEDLANSHEKSFEAIEQKVPQELIKDLDSADLESSSEEEDANVDSMADICPSLEPVAPKPLVPEVSVMKKKPTHRTNVAMEAILRQAQIKPQPLDTQQNNANGIIVNNINNGSGNAVAPISNPASRFQPLTPPRPIRSSRPDFSVPPPRMSGNMAMNMRPRAAPERPMSLNGSSMPSSGFGWGGNAGMSNFGSGPPMMRPPADLAYNLRMSHSNSFGPLGLNPNFMDHPHGPRPDSRSSLLHLIGHQNRPNLGGSSMSAQPSANSGGTYSLFSGPSWNGGAQSLFDAGSIPHSNSGGPSPLERLIQQQQQEQQQQQQLQQQRYRNSQF